MPAKTLHPEPDFTLDASRLDAERGDGGSPTRPRETSRAWMLLVAAVALIVAAAIAWLYLQRRAPAPLPAPLPAVATAPEVSEPAIRHPVEQILAPPATDGRPLPRLNESDAVALESIAAILNGNTFLGLLAPTGIIQHIVATVDNLPRKTVATRILPVKPVAGSFATARSAGGLSIAPDNAARYGLYVRAAESIDTARLAQFYVRLYPLFQQAYTELGYPNGYFNDRLIAVIDHLLGAPEPKGPVYLAQPKVMYEFADPALEDLSAGQKMLVRMGLPNEMRIKAKLREVRKSLAASAAHPS